MSSQKWGFSSKPLHVQISKEQQEAEDNELSDSSLPHSDTDETLCCPSLSDMLSSCSNCCSRCFCCCQSDRKAEEFPKVSYKHLQQETLHDEIDGEYFPETMPYKPVFQFPQGPQQFPTHPQLPFKPNRMELQQPQMKYTPGGGTGRIILPESPFPAPYLHNRGPGLQTPFTEGPIQHQPRAFNGSGVRLITASTQRKKRTSGTQVRLPRDESQSSTIALVDESGTNKLSPKEETLVEERKSHGRHGSLPSAQLSIRRRRRLFSLTAGKRSRDKDMPVSELQLCKYRQIHRARTVGSSPSRQPSIDPEKYRRCQTPECVIGGETPPKSAAEKGRKGLALRKCKTPDVLMTQAQSRGTKRHSDSPETEANLTSSSPSPGSKSGLNEGGEGGIVKESGESQSASEKKESPIMKFISTDGSMKRRRWVSRREKSRKSSGADKGQERKTSKTRTLPAHISSSPHLTSGSIATVGGANTSVITEDPPTILFSLYFDIQRRALAVSLLKAENLPQKPSHQGTCDPFVMMFLLPNKQEVLQSSIKQRTLNPEFQQVFEFGGILANDLKNQVLVFRVFDHDRFSKNDLIGTVLIPLKDADLYGILMRKEIDQRKGLLKQFSAGDLLVSLTYSPDRRILSGIILKATNLRKADIWGLADPYVKVYAIYENKRMNKWKTVVKKNTLVPIYNESFQFDMSGMDIKNVSLEIWVMDYDWFSRNDKMGVVYVGANSPQEVGRCHWLEILSSPEHQTSHWHTIIPYTDLKQVLPLAKQQQRQHQLQLSSRPHQQKKSDSLLAAHDDSDAHSFVSDTPTI